MNTLLHVWARLKRLKWREIRHLILLCLTAISMSFGMTVLDVGSSALFLEKQGLAGIGFNYLMTAIIWIVAGIQGLHLERRRGYGTAWTFCWLTFVWIALIFWMDKSNNLWAYNAIYCLKYVTIFLMSVGFWAIAERYIQISVSSLKFLGVFSFEAVGVAIGGALCQASTPIDLICWGIGALGISTILLKILGWIIKVPKETFIKKIGGVQDISEKTLMDFILIISFTWMFVRLLTEWNVYAFVVEQSVNITQTLGMLCVVFAAVVLISIIGLSKTRFLYTTPFGLLLCALSPCVCMLGKMMGVSSMVYGGAIMFFVVSHLYVNRYLSLLPRPLGLGKGIRLKKLRWLVTIPTAFILVGACLLTLSESIVNWVLLAGGVSLFIFLWVSQVLYGRQVMKMCSLRIWRGGPLMLTYPPLKQMVVQGLSKPNAAEAIYFLNVLNEGYTTGYRRLLIQMLTHPAISVRLFALKKMTKMGLSLREKRRVSELMKSDTCDEVRNMALATLITDALEGNTNTAWHKYKEYLDKKEWIWGATYGFLSGRGAWRAKIIEKVKHLAQSKNEKDNLMALSIMTAHPLNEWVELISQLLNTQNISIMKAALTASGKLASPVLLNRLLSLLDEVRWRDHVLEALNEYGKHAFPMIEKTILNDLAPLDRKKNLVLFLGRLPSGEGKQILLRALFNADRSLKMPIIESLEDAEIVWVHKDRKRVLKQAINECVKEWYEMQQMLIHAENLEETKLEKVKDLFVVGIEEEMNRTRALILEQIALYILMPLGRKAVEVLKGNDLNSYAGAVSCLQDILPPKMYAKLRSVLLYPTVNEPPDSLEKMPTEAFLNSFALNTLSWTNPWLQALALYGWRELDNPAGLVAVKEGLSASNWNVLETALSALGKLEKNKKKAEEMALAVPTRYLLKQNFEELLEDKHVNHH